MRYLHAPVVLAAMMSSATAFGETRTSIAVISAPSAQAPTTNAGAPPTCNFSYCSPQIARYNNTRILSITEYTITGGNPPCQFKDAGYWTNATSVQPTDTDGTPAGTVDVSQPAWQGPTPSGCTDAGGPYYYAPIYFNWTLHKNLTAVSGYGPVATFSAKWTTNPDPIRDPTGDGKYNELWSFQVLVPVVRPAGEMITYGGDFVGGTDVAGKWLMTLTPPSTDPSFDFKDEVVKEQHGTKSTTCNTPYPLFGRSPLQQSLGTAPTTENTWVVGEQLITFKGETNPPQAGKNQWGFDDLGLSRCFVEAARCAMIAMPSCGNTVIQNMQIHSPADQPNVFVDYVPPQVNELTEGVNGQIFGGAGNPQKLGNGYFYSKRAKQGDTSAPQIIPNVPSSINSCDALVVASSRYLLHCPTR